MFSIMDRFNKTKMPSQENALPGRAESIETSNIHFVNGHPLKPPFPDGYRHIVLGMGCFWGVERLFWNVEGVYVTAVGYAGGYTPNPTYEEVCSGLTGHTEVVLIVYDPTVVSINHLLKIFWEEHDPTQGMRQGNDIGNNYRSALYLSNNEDLALAMESRDVFQKQLDKNSLGIITSGIALEGPFYYAEAYHQQYLAKNPNGYCGIKGTGVSCPIGVFK